MKIKFEARCITIHAEDEIEQVYLGTLFPNPRPGMYISWLNDSRTLVSYVLINGGIVDAK